MKICSRQTLASRLWCRSLLQAISKAILWHCFFPASVPNWKFQNFNFCVLIGWNTAEFCLVTPGIQRSFLSRSTSQHRESKTGLFSQKTCWRTLLPHFNQAASHCFEVAQKSTVTHLKKPLIYLFEPASKYTFPLRNIFLNLLDSGQTLLADRD